jgi:hypothetical protein
MLRESFSSSESELSDEALDYFRRFKHTMRRGGVFVVETFNKAPPLIQALSMFCFALLVLALMPTFWFIPSGLSMTGMLVGLGALALLSSGIAYAEKKRLEEAPAAESTIKQPIRAGQENIAFLDKVAFYSLASLALLLPLHFVGGYLIQAFSDIMPLNISLDLFATFVLTGLYVAVLATPAKDSAADACRTRRVEPESLLPQNATGRSLEDQTTSSSYGTFRT